MSGSKGSSASRPILVTGAGGFIGRQVVSHLLGRGLRVRAMVHTWNPFDARPGLEVVRADIRDAAAVARAVADTAAVVHLAAAKSDEQDSDAINVGGAGHLIDACRAAGCRRIVNISTQSTKIARKGTYGRTKLAADLRFHASGLDVTTLRVSIVYGEAREGVFGTLLAAVERMPVVPVFGDGAWVSAPVDVRDVATAVADCLEHDNTIGGTYDVGGPTQIAFDELIDILARGVGRMPRIVHVPVRLSLLLAGLLDRVMKRPPLTVSNVLGSSQPTDIDITPARTDWGFAPAELRPSIARLLSRVGVPVARSPMADEARLLGRYLLDADPSPALVARYEDACTRLLGDAADPDVAFVRRHPWALPALDAATGVVRPASGLRQRVRLMAAILETTPRHATFFLQEPASIPALVASLLVQGLRSIVMLVAGIPLCLFVRASRPWPPATSS